MRCPQCAERNSVAARKCEFCGEKFKKKPLPLGLKLAAGGIAVAVTASIAASYLVPRLVDPEETLGRAAKQLAAGPTSVDHAKKVKADFATALKNFLKTAGDDKTSTLTAALQKLLPSSAFEVHVVDLPRGLRVVEIDTVLQATSFLVMKTSAGTKVFDLPGFEVFDDARILNDSAGPVLALLGHTSGPPPHKPIVRTYALLPDYIADETDKLVPPFKVDGNAKFATNGQDIQIEFSVPAVASSAANGRKKGASTVSGERLAFGNLKWKDARYTSDFGAIAAVAASRTVKQSPAIAAAGAPAKLPDNDITTAIMVPAAPNAVAHAPAPQPAPQVVPRAVAPGKIVVRSFTAADAARSNSIASAAKTAMTSDSVLAAVPMAAPAINNAKSTIQSIASEMKKSPSSETRSSSKRSSSSNSSKGEVIASGATLRSAPTRGAAAMNSFGRGTQVTVLGKEQDWYHVRVNGQDGYIYSSLLSVGSSGSSTAVASTQPSTSSESRRSRRRRNSAAAQHAMLVADATSSHKNSRKRQVAAVEPILVP